MLLSARLPQSVRHKEYGKISHLNRTWSADVASLLLVLGVFILVAEGISHMHAPLASMRLEPVTTNLSELPYYTLRSVLRMFLALSVSLFFTLCYATLAAKSKLLERFLIPILDVIQSVPILGYISFTVTAFVALFPGSMLGVECAAIFAIFTSQVPNLAFSLYYSLKSVPQELLDAGKILQLNGWQRYWKIELPYAVPGLVWNIVMSMAGGWFFVVASEAITVGNEHFMLPGIGSYIAIAIHAKNTTAIIQAVMAMTLAIVATDQLFFRPLIVWADKFRTETTARQNAPHSWLYMVLVRSTLINVLMQALCVVFKKALWLRLFPFVMQMQNKVIKEEIPQRKLLSYVVGQWCLRGLEILIALTCGWLLFREFNIIVGLHEVWHVMKLGAITCLRVLLLLALASIVWIPLGIIIGLRPRLVAIFQPIAQFMASFPANLLFPVVVIAITRYHLNPDIWLSVLMIMGTQWYIAFNVIAAAANFPNDLTEICQDMHVRGWIWWKKVMIPGVLPYYCTGVITAAGGAWNASIVAEIVSWGDITLITPGLGSYIAQGTLSGNMPHIILGVVMMSLWVVMLGRFLWQPLQHYFSEKYTLNY